MSPSRSGLPLAIVPVRTKADMRRFFGMTRLVYSDDPYFVQPLTFERMEHVDAKKNPAFDHIEAAYWIVFRGTDVVGRISAQINRFHLERYDDATAQFGFFEAIDDPEVIELLFDTVEIWARDKGMKRLQGPFSLSINDESGLLIDGFDRIPNMMMPHGRPYYDERLDALGYTKAKDLLAFEMASSRQWPARAKKLVERTLKSPSISVRDLDMSRYQEEIRLVCDIFNDAWADNWNFIPFGREEIEHLAKNMRPIITPKSVAIGELDGEAVAMSVTLPNLNEAIADLDGRLFPFGWAKLIWRLKVKGVSNCRMPLAGLRRKLHGSAKGAGVFMATIDRLDTHHRNNGVTHGELSWILEDNDRIRRIIEAVGGQLYKTYRVYQRDI